MANILFVAPGGAGVRGAIASASSTLQSRTPSRHTITSLHDQAATRTKVDAELGNHGVVFFFGHGEKDELTGRNSALIDAANVNNVADVLVAIACLAGAGLGQTFGASLQRGFLGFDSLLVIPPFAPTPAVESIENALTPLLGSTATIDAGRDRLKRELLSAAGRYLSDRTQLGISDSDALTAHCMLRSNSLGVIVEGAISRAL